ncbi:hypothetical protein V1508DRAFT_435255 [Lipomyces doorenjongii]|uniref:uncharacterized protein n=1 Tax=Lipomyces doorenjongii TaxID=383834 RepID=UPI0034CFA6C7
MSKYALELSLPMEAATSMANDSGGYRLSRCIYFLFSLSRSTLYFWSHHIGSYDRTCMNKRRSQLRRMYGMGDEKYYDSQMKRLEGDVAVSKLHQPNIEGWTLLGIPLPMAEMECFRRKNLKRTITAILAASGQQLIGATFVTGYATYFVELINIQTIS